MLAIGNLAQPNLATAQDIDQPLGMAERNITVESAMDDVDRSSGIPWRDTHEVAPAVLDQATGYGVGIAIL